MESGLVSLSGALAQSRRIEVISRRLWKRRIETTIEASFPRKGSTNPISCGRSAVRSGRVKSVYLVLRLQGQESVQAQTASHQHQDSHQTSFRWSKTPYARRSPEATLLYKVVQENLRSFEALCALEGQPLPAYVAAEFEAYLKCGVLAHGFLRLKCQDCRFERLVAFSCKKRGFCSCCGARRMAQSAAHLSDHVFPPATMVRQWVLTMPVPLRYFCARQPQVQTKILRLVQAVIAKSIKGSIPTKGASPKKLQTGAVTLIQRFGGHVNLNIHFHMLHVQGAWSLSQDKTSATFHPAANPSQEELLECVQKIAAGALKILKQMKLVELGPEGGDVLSTSDAEEEPLSRIQSASLQNTIGLGVRKGQRLRRLVQRLEDDLSSGHAQMSGPMAASYGGFSLHAGVSVWSSNKARLEQLIRYTARPALSQERLTEGPGGELHYRLKKPWSDGSRAVVFAPLELMEKLAALVPPPRVHLTRFHGIFAPNGPGRKLVVPGELEDQEAADGADAKPGSPCQAKPSPNSRTYSWSKLLARVFALDMESCELCGGRMKLVAALLKAELIEKILLHLGMPARAPPIAPSRVAEQGWLWDQETPGDEGYSQVD